jgi:hypothetical protein
MQIFSLEGAMAGLLIAPVLVCWAERLLHWEFLRLWCDWGSWCELVAGWLVEGWLVGASAVRLGASLRLAAYVCHREATKARRVRGGVRAVGGRAAPL